MRTSLPRARARGALLTFSVTATVFAGTAVAVPGSAAVPEPGPAGAVARVSLTEAGGQRTSSPSQGAMSSNGRFVQYVVGQTLYVYDTETGVTQAAVSTSTEPPGNDVPRGATISDDGRYVAFASAAADLDATAPAGQSSAYLKDRSTGALVRLSEAASNPAVSAIVEAVVSADGRYVVVASGFPVQVSRYTVATGEQTVVSLGPGGQPAVGSSFQPAISADGRYVAFLYAGPTSEILGGSDTTRRQLFIRDLETGTTSWASRGADGVGTSARIERYLLSGNGRYVTFDAFDSNLVEGDDNGVDDVFRYDRVSDTVTAVSTTADGTFGNAASYYGYSSDDGSTVVYYSSATNLVPDNDGGRDEYYAKDMASGATVRLVTNAAGERPDAATGTLGPPPSRIYAATSSTFRLLFTSAATNLVDGDTNGIADLFVYDAPRAASGAPTVSPAPRVGAPVNATVAAPEGTTSTYQWNLDGMPIAGATGRSFTPLAPHVGRGLTVTVRSTRFAASPAVTTSTSAVVARGVLTASTPRVAGTPRVGRTLRAVPGRWSVGTTFTYRWLADGRPIRSATASTLVLRRAQRGAAIAVVVTGRKAGYADLARTSAPTRTVR